MPECPYKQDPEYASRPNYAKIPKTTNFRIWQGSEYASVTQRSEYAKICLDRVLNIILVANMSEFWTWQGSEYARVAQGSK